MGELLFFYSILKSELLELSIFHLDELFGVHYFINILDLVAFGDFCPKLYSWVR